MRFKARPERSSQLRKLFYLDLSGLENFWNAPRPATRAKMTTTLRANTKRNPTVASLDDKMLSVYCAAHSFNNLPQAQRVDTL